MSIKINLVNPFQFVLFLIWIAALVIAKGFWSTFFAIFFPPYAIYLVMERFLEVMNWI